MELLALSSIPRSVRSVSLYEECCFVVRQSWQGVLMSLAVGLCGYLAGQLGQCWHGMVGMSTTCLLACLVACRWSDLLPSGRGRDWQACFSLFCPWYFTGTAIASSVLVLWRGQSLINTAAGAGSSELSWAERISGRRTWLPTEMLEGSVLLCLPSQVMHNWILEVNILLEGRRLWSNKLEENKKKMSVELEGRSGVSSGGDYFFISK